MLNARTIRCAFATAAALSVVSIAAAGGPLSPPAGPPSATPGPEPRTPINDLPGDSTAMHIISAPGSYYLSANVIGSSGLDGVRVETAGSVSIDGMGFSMTASAAAGSAILIIEAPDQDVQIDNVRVRGWDIGIHAMSHARTHFSGGNITLKRGVISAAATNGILAPNSPVAIAVSNIGSSGQDGVVLGDGSTIDDCDISDNSGVGVRAGRGMIMKGSKILQNFAGGADVGDDAQMFGNTFDGSVVSGLYVNFKSNIVMMDLDHPAFAPTQFNGGLHDIAGNHFDVRGSNTFLLPAVQIQGDDVTVKDNLFIGRPGAGPPAAQGRMPPHYTLLSGLRHDFQGNSMHVSVAGTEALGLSGGWHSIVGNKFHFDGNAAAAIIGNVNDSFFAKNEFHNIFVNQYFQVTGTGNVVAPTANQGLLTSVQHPYMNVIIEPTSAP